MRLRRSIARIAIVAGSLVLIGALLLVSVPNEKAGAGSGNGLALVRPAFAQSSEASFLEEEAGIAAYVNVGQTIDLGKVKKAFRDTRAEGSNYVIGIMELPGNPEEEFPHMCVTSDGWIFAYYSRIVPSSRIMNWGKYRGGEVSTTTLYEAISRICPAIGVNITETSIAYYHFNYPDASKLTMAVAYEAGDTDSDTFTYSVPSSVIGYEVSFSHYSESWLSDVILIPDQGRAKTVSDLQSRDIPQLSCARLDEQYWIQEAVYQVQLGRYHDEWPPGEGRMGVAVIFIHHE